MTICLTKNIPRNCRFLERKVAFRVSVSVDSKQLLTIAVFWGLFCREKAHGLAFIIHHWSELLIRTTGRKGKNVAVKGKSLFTLEPLIN